MNGLSPKVSACRYKIDMVGKCFISTLTQVTFTHCLPLKRQSSLSRASTDQTKLFLNDFKLLNTNQRCLLTDPLTTRSRVPTTLDPRLVTVCYSTCSCHAMSLTVDRCCVKQLRSVRSLFSQLWRPPPDSCRSQRRRPDQGPEHLDFRRELWLPPLRTTQDSLS